MQGRNRCCVVVLCGLPGAGKSTTCRKLTECCQGSQDPVLVSTVHGTKQIESASICVECVHFDDVVHSTRNEGDVDDDDTDNDCLGDDETKNPDPLTHDSEARNGDLETFFDHVEWKRNREATMTVVQSVMCHSKEPQQQQQPQTQPQQLRLLLLDDNMYLRSMRHHIYMLAKQACTGFVQLSIRVPLKVAEERNDTRDVSARVPLHVIRRMSARFEWPSAAVNIWESHTLDVDNIGPPKEEEWYRVLLHDLGTKALDSCIKAERDAEKKDASNAAKERDRLQTQTSVLHRADCALRETVSRMMRCDHGTEKSSPISDDKRSRERMARHVPMVWYTLDRRYRATVLRREKDQILGELRSNNEAFRDGDVEETTEDGIEAIVCRVVNSFVLRVCATLKELCSSGGNGDGTHTGRHVE